MPRYIEATNAISVLSLFYNFTDAERYDLALAISTVPTADATKVVMCKDCKWKQGSECTRFADVRPSPDDYCSRGERKEVEDGR